MPCIHRGFRAITRLQIETSPIADRVCHDWYSQKEHSTGSSLLGISRQWEIPLCRVCGLAPEWFCYHCNACSNIFLKDFADPRFCFCESYCWSHLSESPHSRTTGCFEHASNFSLGQRFEPIGLNERLLGITEQEYDDILTELGIDF